MSTNNSIARGDREPDTAAEPAGFQMPPALASRYTVRVIDGADGAQRLGLFRPGHRGDPSIDITDDRIVARREDPETIAALVAIAKANCWERIALDVSPEFRRAVWEDATREGLAISGYEPTFAEQERVDEARRSAAKRPDRGEQAGEGAVEHPDAADVSKAAGRPSAEPTAPRPRHSDSEELAELFLGGNANRIAAEPRLAPAMQAQVVMEQHIREVFGNDPAGQATATLESRQMISDALRRGLDVAIREPTPARQLEPMHSRPDLER